MDNFLRRKLESFREEHQLTTYAFERKVGLPQHSLQGILEGGQKGKPYLKTLFKLCHFFQCSLDALTGNPKTYLIYLPRTRLFDATLYKECVLVMEEMWKKNPCPISFSEGISLVGELYLYSRSMALAQKVDLEFASLLATYVAHRGAKNPSQIS